MAGEIKQFDFCLLIPCHNDESALISSLQSINYPFHQFVVLVIDDGSTKAVNYTSLLPKIPAGMIIEIIRLENNLGIVKALNAGLAWLSERSEFRFVARLDCGDICEKQRFFRQVEFLDQHPEIKMVGSWCVFKDFDNKNSYLYKTPTGLKKISRGMHFRNLFIHPTVMWRSTVMTNRSYPENFPHAEEYGLFYSLIREKQLCAIIPESLMVCKLSKNGISGRNRKAQLESRMKLVKQFGENEILKWLGILKLKLLLLMPPAFILQIKMIFLKTRSEA